VLAASKARALCSRAELVRHSEGEDPPSWQQFSYAICLDPALSYTSRTHPVRLTGIHMAAQKKSC
jgi:hypothetical protein